jgi:hypothetical protein
MNEIITYISILDECESVIDRQGTVLTFSKYGNKRYIFSQLPTPRYEQLT